MPFASQFRSLLGFGSSFVRNEVRALLRRDPDRREAALAFAREHATPGAPESVLRALDRFARERRFLMNVGDEKGPLLEDLVRKAGPTARVLELGSFVGYSAILMAQHLEAPGRVVSIDASPTARRVASQMAELAGVGDRTEFHDGGSEVVIPTLAEPFDVVFLDHLKGLYRGDMERILEGGLLRPGAVVVADNLGPMFGENPYLPWMQARTDFESTLVDSHVEYSEVPDAVLVSHWKPRAATRRER